MAMINLFLIPKLLGKMNGIFIIGDHILKLEDLFLPCFDHLLDLFKFEYFL